MDEMRISKYDHRDTYVKRIVIAAAALCVFLLMHYLYSSGISMEFDLAVGEAVRSLRSPVLNAIMIPITHLGNKWTLIGIGIVLIVIDIVRWKKNDYPLAVLACLINLLIYKILKVLVQRPRPDQIFWLVIETGYSFPSGHSMNGIFCYGMMIYLLQRNCEDKKLRDILTVVLAAIIPLIAWTSSAVWQYTRSPFFSSSVGPSSMSQGVTTQAFPGLSIFNWVPRAMNSSMAYMVAVL